ncbi:hypothetical protein PCC8801_3558 [Rippkaea orientalis PCC 8801]|uniref:Carrier domain-containing protein n=1 Tax=Rippkaea orientalis (strain PCC 8801 / RF-1) TaxID=41431 RepID=B7K1I0_RIPO1|nr:acyl carrier protein [Rippkaea orientalis]ACK67522.1 hypothetical protein PCC8801_3558 [Rippkaea orientalis PCC 8801]
MTTNDPLYTSNILKQAIISYLDQNVPKTEQGLTILVSQCDDLVWNIATYIYNKTGHQVEFSLIRDIINNRIELLKQYIADRNAEEARRLAEEIERNQIEAIRLVEKNRRLAEEAKIKQEQEAIRLAEEARIKQEQEAIRLAKQPRINELSRQLKESGRDEKLSELFSQLQKIISEQLRVELDKITLDSNLDGDEFDRMELLMSLEEHFNIEIPDDQSDNIIWLKSTKPIQWFSSEERTYYIDYTVGQLLDAMQEILEQDHPDKLKIAT